MLYADTYAIHHTISIRVGSWSVETLNSTCLAECMLGHVGVERVGCYVLSSLQLPTKSCFRKKNQEYKPN